MNRELWTSEGLSVPIEERLISVDLKRCSEEDEDGNRGEGRVIRGEREEQSDRDKDNGKDDCNREKESVSMEEDD
jgi:hypothetical protein